MNNRNKQQKLEWLADFRAARKRSLKRRLDYAFIHTSKPFLDEAPYRAFTSMKAYRDWCQRHLPGWLGYGRSL